jgi:hypothetical protein
MLAASLRYRDRQILRGLQSSDELVGLLNIPSIEKSLSVYVRI